MTIQNARSNTSGNAPASLQDGQIAINQADDVLYTRKPNGSSRPTLLPKRYGVADAAFTARTFDTYIGIASLTATRILTLPAASAYPVGHGLAIVDESGVVSPTVSLTITAAGTDKINGNATLPQTTPYGGALLFSDGVSKWTAIALPASGATNSVLYVAQSLTSGQQDQARTNISGAVTAYQSSTASLALLDFERDQYVTGTSTITMPSVSPGWRSGIVVNDNQITGLVTLAVPAGHLLDGVTNGSTVLYPFQRARLRMVSAGAWRTDWVDRAPIITSLSITSPVASADINIPAGFSRFRFGIVGVSMSTGGALLGVRFSDNGTTGLKSGATDYNSNRFAYYASTSAAAAANDSYGYLAQGIFDNGGLSRTMSQGWMYPGATGQQPMMLFKSYRRNSDPNFIAEEFSIAYLGTTSGNIGRVNLMRIFASTGNINSGATLTIWGEP